MRDVKMMINFQFIKVIYMKNYIHNDGFNILTLSLLAATFIVCW